MTHHPEDLAATLLKRARRRREGSEHRMTRARDAVVSALRDCIREGIVTRAWLIGSGAWGGVHSRSDLDVVVEGSPEPQTGSLWDRLSGACGMDVDLLRYEELEPRFRERVRTEGVEVDGT